MYHIERQLSRGIHYLRPHNLGEAFAALDGKVVTVNIDLLFTTEPLAEL